MPEPFGPTIACTAPGVAERARAVQCDHAAKILVHVLDLERGALDPRVLRNVASRGVDGANATPKHPFDLADMPRGANNIRISSATP